PLLARSSLFPYTTLFRSLVVSEPARIGHRLWRLCIVNREACRQRDLDVVLLRPRIAEEHIVFPGRCGKGGRSAVFEESGLKEHTLTRSLCVMWDLYRETLGERF